MAGVRYYGCYSNVSRGKRKETEEDGITTITLSCSRLSLGRLSKAVKIRNKEILLAACWIA
ncbi:MAG: hypothetical protein FJ117_22090 [Deltaproteobacteria bacterium]|nr:hypothetical protein [Deltaproteobacteria bacterium]